MRIDFYPVLRNGRPSKLRIFSTIFIHRTDDIVWKSYVAIQKSASRIIYCGRFNYDDIFNSCAKFDYTEHSFSFQTSLSNLYESRLQPIDVHDELSAVCRMEETAEATRSEGTFLHHDDDSDDGEIYHNHTIKMQNANVASAQRSQKRRWTLKAFLLRFASSKWKKVHVLSQTQSRFVHKHLYRIKSLK